MTTGGRVEIRGLDRLRSTMKRAERELNDMSTPLQVAADATVRAARPPSRSGRLRASISSTAGNERATVTASVPYAGVIHWGHPRRRIRANPFLSAAATGTESSWIKAFEHEVDDALDRIKGV